MQSSNLSSKTIAAAVAVTKQAPPKRRARALHYVFGYGSLICPESRSITNPNLKDKETLPVVIRDVERIWSARTNSGYTCMGVRFRDGAECTGVLIEVKADELADLDKREAMYDRLPIQLDNIDQVPFLEEEFYEDDHPVFVAQDDSNKQLDDKNVKVWIYMQRDAIEADPSHPIPQSYVDIIIRGCLTISEDFARSFIETTHGWNNEEDLNHWVDDRDLPIYRRADPDFSSEHGDAIDKLLGEHIEDELEEHRVQYDPIEHLDKLADALEDDKADPRAIKHIIKKVKEATATSEEGKQE